MGANSFVKNVMSLVLRREPYSMMFFGYGAVLGLLFVFVFNQEGRGLVVKLLGALSSPDLFVIMLTASAVVILGYTMITGPLDGPMPSVIRWCGEFPAQVALDFNRSLLAFTVGLCLSIWIESVTYLLVLGFVILVVAWASVLMACLLVFSRKCFVADVEFLRRDFAGVTWFQVVQGTTLLFVVVVFALKLVF